MRLLVALGLALAVLSAQAEDRWVTDNLEVPIRSGESNEFRILRFLDSGTPVTVIERNAATGYSLIRDERGREGFVLTRYLEDEPTAELQLEALQARLDAIMDDAQNGAQRVAQLREELDQVRSERNALTAQNSSLEAELERIREVTAEPMAINRANQELRERVQVLEEQSAELESENLRLNDDRDKSFMTLGAGLVFAGIVLGLLLPSLKRKRRNDNWF